MEPVRQCRLSNEELSLFLTTYTKAVTEGTVSLEPGLRGSFSKFMVTMTVIITTFYR